MSRKSSKDLSEKDREVNIHFFRFAKFLRYLQEYDATIETVNPENGETIIYRHDKSSDGLPLENLVSDALDIEHEYARDLLSRRLTLSDRQSNKEKIKKLGDTVYGITVHKSDKGRSDELPIPITKISYKYYHLKSYSKPPFSDLTELHSEGEEEMNKHREFSIDPKWKDILHKYVNDSVAGYVNDQDFISRVAGVNFVGFPVFEVPILQLKMVLKEENMRVNENKSVLKLKEELLKLVRVYNQVLEQHNIQNSIIPNYRDFTILTNEDLIDKCIGLYFEDRSDQFLELAYSFSTQELIYFRYEVLNKLIIKQENVEEWPMQFQALLMLSNYELEGVHALFRELIANELNSIRYTFLTKNSHNNTRIQETNLTIDKLLEYIQQYDVSELLEDIFKLKGNHILEKPLFKYPVKEAVNYNYPTFEIRKKLNQIIEQFIRQKLYDDLNMSNRLLPEDRDSAILL